MLVHSGARPILYRAFSQTPCSPPMRSLGWCWSLSRSLSLPSFRNIDRGRRMEAARRGRKEMGLSREYDMRYGKILAHCLSRKQMDKESHFAKIIAGGYFLPESLTVCLYYCTL